MSCYSYLLFAGTTVTFTYYTFETALLSGSYHSENIILIVVKYIILLIPPLNFSLAFEKFLMTWRINNLVKAFVDKDFTDEKREDRLTKGTNNK